MENYMILVTSLAVKFSFTNIKDNINIKGKVVHSEILLKDDPLRVFKGSKNKITFT